MHPETGRQSLFMGGHVYGISDMTPEDPGQFLNSLVDEACHVERAIEHTWTPWGVMVRYNSRLLHRAMPCDERHETIISLNCRNTDDPDGKRNSEQSGRTQRRDGALERCGFAHADTSFQAGHSRTHTDAQLGVRLSFFQESRRTPWPK